MTPHHCSLIQNCLFIQSCVPKSLPIHIYPTMPFSKSWNASSSIPEVCPRWRQSATLSGLIAHYPKQIALAANSQWWLLIFFFLLHNGLSETSSKVWCLVGMAASWEHISECFCSWSFSVSSLWSSLLSLHRPLHHPIIWPISGWREEVQNSY